MKNYMHSGICCFVFANLSNAVTEIKTVLLFEGIPLGHTSEQQPSTTVIPVTTVGTHQNTGSHSPSPVTHILQGFKDKKESW